VVKSRLWHIRGSDLSAFVRWENSITMVMSLTDTGSERLEVSEVVEFHVPDATARLIDGRFYEEENKLGVLQ